MQSFYAIKAFFSALEAQEYKDLKAKPHEDIVAYMDNLDVEINTKELELQQLKNFKICSKIQQFKQLIMRMNRY
jgi:hypothetical protein